MIMQWDDFSKLSGDEAIKFTEDMFLFKFGKREHLEEIAKGRIRFGAISNYTQGPESDITDEKECRMVFPEGCEITIDGKKIGDTMNIEYRIEKLEGYGIFCASKPMLEIIQRNDDCCILRIRKEYVDNMEKLGKDSGYGHVAVLNRMFFDRICKDHISIMKWQPVSYYDEEQFPDLFSRIRDDPAELAYCKRSRFSYQREFRVLCNIPLKHGEHETIEMSPDIFSQIMEIDNLYGCEIKICREGYED